MRAQDTNEQAVTTNNMPPSLSADINEALREMISVSMQINELYEKETAFLKDNDTRGFVSLQESKIRLAHAYQAGSKELIQRKNELVHADATLKQKLKDLRNDFIKIGAENETVLAKVHKNVKRLSDRILNMARDAAQKAQVRGYNASGATTQAQKSVAVSVSEEA